MLLSPRHQLLLGALALGLLLSGTAGAADLATVEVSPETIYFQPAAADVGLALTVAGPGDFFWQRTFEPGSAPALDASTLIDGTYKWQLVAIPSLDGSTRAALARARATGDDGIVDRLREQGKLPTIERTQSGVFTLAEGAILDPTLRETTDGDFAAASQRIRAASGGPTAVAEGVLSNLSEEFFVSDDLYVHNSACIGFDCPSSGGSFSFDTIRMMENSLRIHFDDTSTLSGFPNRDWRLVANDSGSGGLNKFSIEDSTGSLTPFTIEAAARTNALYVESDGDVGFGTNNPVVNLHVVDGNTPTVRLEQDGSSGFAPQTWDIAGNETNFFIRDVTGGSQLALRIRPGADTNSIFIDNDNDIGFGTASIDADVRFQINANTSSNFGGLRVENAGSGNIQTQFAGNTWEWRQTFRSGDLIFDSQEDGANELVLTTGGVLTVTTLVETSDRNLKENFEQVPAADILDRLAAIPIQRWNFTEDSADTPHLGPMAQDFYAAFGLGADDQHIAATDAHGVALAAIQALYQRLLEKEELLQQVLTQNQALEQRLSALEAMEP